MGDAERSSYFPPLPALGPPPEREVMLPPPSSPDLAAQRLPSAPPPAAASPEAASPDAVLPIAPEPTLVAPTGPNVSPALGTLRPSASPSRTSLDAGRGSISPSRLSLGPSRTSLSPRRRSLFDLSHNPSTARPTVSILPPLPFARGASWSSFGLVGLLGIIVVFLVVRWTGALEGMARPAVGKNVTAAARMDEMPWFPVPTRTRAAKPAAEVEQKEDEGARADAHLRRTGRSSLSRGVFFLPPTFASADGGFDLVLFFHGNTDLAEEGMILSGINAAVVIFNFGNGSNAYEERFHDPSRFTDTLLRVHDELRSRGLEKPHVNRIALVSWSAGYGATQGILQQPKLADLVDAIVVLDGMHAGFIGDGPEIAPGSLAPFVSFAERAKKNEKLFVLTHSNVEPVGYASVARSADYLLKLVDVPREKVEGETFLPAYASLSGVLPQDELVTLKQRSQAHSGSLIIKGYGGNQANHHIMHLVQFPDTAMGPLVERWMKK
ncbi:MAG: hypothetical protein HOW73_37365 [Polyangiaceae bacterium]|nr:hypothetical protein [Polyangiaceae bacterium]